MGGTQAEGDGPREMRCHGGSGFLAAVITVSFATACLPFARITSGSPPAQLQLADSRPSVAPLVGRVLLGDLYEVAAKINPDIANGATVSLIDTASNNTVSSTVSSSTGEFTLGFGSSFVPQNAVYYLEAVKGLSQNQAGAVAARVRTLVRYSGGTWSTVTAGGLTISKATTALSVIVSYRGGTPHAADVLALMGALDLSGSPPAFRDSGTRIAQADYATVYGFVDTALESDLDPFKAIGYNQSTNSFISPVTSLPQILHLTPSLLQAGSTVTLFGVNFGTTAGANIVTFSGQTALAVLANPGSSATQLLVTPPAGVTSGLVTVKTSTGTSNGVPYTTTEPISGVAIQ